MPSPDDAPPRAVTPRPAGREESARYWRSPALGGLELLEGRFRRHAYRPHAHPGYVIAVITGGVESLRCRGRRHLAGPGDIIFVNPEEIHDGEPGAEGGWRYRVFYPDAGRLAALRPGPHIPRFRETVVRDPGLADALRALHAGLDPADPLASGARWLGLLDLALARHAGGGRAGTAGPAAPRQVGRARALIEAEDGAARDLDALAEAVGLSPFHLLRAFKAAFGITPHAFRIACRVRRAKRLIEAGEPVAQAAVAAGLADQSHLIRHFRAIYGVTPGRYAAGHGASAAAGPAISSNAERVRAG